MERPFVHARFDQLGKNVLCDALGRAAKAEAQVEVPSTDAQYIDIWSVPTGTVEPVAALGRVLGAIAAEPAMVECFSEAVGNADVRACLRKQYQWAHVRQRSTPAILPLPVLWIVSAGWPARVVADYGFMPSRLAPGHYRLPQTGFRFHLLVPAELDPIRDTVLLRLLGPQPTRLQAMRDLLALPDDAWEKRVALPWLYALRFEVPQEPDERTEEERDVMANAHELLDKFQRESRAEGLREGLDEGLRKGLDEGLRKGLDEGLRKGLDEGRRGVLVRFFEKRLRRPLDEAERFVVADRLARVGEDRLEEVVLSLDATALAGWLADPMAS